jgi:YfiH family protein
VDPIYLAPGLSQFDWLEHGFGDRDYRPAASLTTLRQIHSDITAHADRPDCPPEGDALLSSTPGQLVAVKTADCLPILLVDERHRAVAAVHAGWRGTVSRIAQKTIQAMAARWDTRATDLHAAIGPGIGGCCYEVGPEVAMRFAALFPERADLDRKTRIDLAEANRRQLVEAGVSPGRIYSAAQCTFCSPGFHSFRRDGEAAGRMYSFIGVKAPPRSQCETSAETSRSS